MVVHFSDGSVWEEHQQYEIIGYQGLTKPDEEQDDEVKKQSLAILRKWGFPPEPIPCSYTGRWFKTMMQCPSGRAFYMDREAQKKHWKKQKKEANDRSALAGQQVQRLSPALAARGLACARSSRNRLVGARNRQECNA